MWLGIVQHIPKGARHTVGNRIEERFLDLLEVTYVTYFTAKDGKAAKLAECIFMLDTLKFLISVVWEGRLISHQHYESVSLKLDEVGRMFGGWRKSLDNPDKKNHAL